MALTQIRGEQIRDGIIKNSHIALNAAIDYSKLDLAERLVASDLNTDGSIAQNVLESKLFALWDMVQSLQTGTDSSVQVTSAVQAAASTDAFTINTNVKGVLLTGGGVGGEGTQNYRVQIRRSSTGEPVADGTDSDPSDAANAGSVYGELRYEGTDYVLYFFKSDNTPYTFATDTQIDILFLEVYSYLDAPAMGFIAGVGFADVVGISGSHNHHDLYFTKLQLTGGSLDGRYYTQTDLNNGQLDTRYYTESELDGGQLDNRYYTETELGSTATGSSGAGLIGVTAVGDLAATTVQDALAELQGDITAIIEGTTDIHFSMDDTYKDGSVVVVDDTNVDFKLDDTKKFQISDSDGVAIMQVNALEAGDTVVVAGSLDQSGGSVSLNAGSNNIDIDGATVTVDGSSIALASTGALTLKDQYLTAGIPLSQTGEAALVGYTATSIVGALNEALTAASTATGIGTAEDGTYTDGLFVDFVPTTPTGTAVDRFNEVLKSLAPQPAPALSNIGIDNGGVSGKLSFGSSAPISGYTNHPTLDIGGAYTKSGNIMGIFDNVGTMTGFLANSTAAQPNNRPYPARAFGNGDLGTLKLKVNGVDVHTVDLSSFSSGNSVNANGSGFSLSASTSVKFDNGNDFDVFKYRTGTWIVGVADCDKGYNTLQVVHTTTGDSLTNTVNFVIDDATDATSYASESLASLSMTGSKQISGITYHTAGTAVYSIQASNVYRNTYSASSSAIDFTGTNASVSDKALSIPAANTSTASISETATVITSSRLLDASIAVNVNVARTLQATSTSSGASISGILLDATTDNATALVEAFNGETFRMNNAVSLTTTSGYDSVGTSPAEWVSSESLVGATSTHNDGLLVYNGTLRYPKTGLNSGNFSSVSNGPTNPDYSSATGNRTFYRYFYTSSAKSNFKLAVTATSTSFVSVATGVSGNNLNLQVLAPNTTTDGSTVVWKDGVASYIDDSSVGCYAATYGGTIPTNWGMTLGTKNTSTSGNVIVVKITASADWTGNISNITLTWL